MSSTEIDALVGQYSHLASFPREKEALHALKKIASLVKPIMRARHWRVGTLAEFYPDQHNLLGINVNRGQKICLRLRYPGDKNQFLPIEQVVDTMLHELSHNVHGPHDEKFHALWDQLRKEHEALISKGYTGEGFMSEGHRLGGRSIPRDEARRIARAAAEKRRVLSAGSGQKLGGRGIRIGDDVRRVIADAAERRSTVLRGCGSNNKNFTEREVIDLADEATANGFQTQAEEDEANERAIAQALWELVQEDEKKQFGNDYIAPSPQHPAGNAGVIEIEPEYPTNTASSSSRPSTSSSSTTTQRKSQPSRPVSRLVSDPGPKPYKPNSSTVTPRISEHFIPPSPPKSKPTTLAAPSGWTCEICTLHNPINYLCCDACGTERPERVTSQVRQAEQTLAAAEKKESATWSCTYCTTIMENKWWTCSTCGQMKVSS